jgi:hypothetical protein
MEEKGSRKEGGFTEGGWVLRGSRVIERGKGSGLLE